MPILLNWIFISICGIAVQIWLFSNKDLDKFDKFMYVMLYIFASPVLHVIMWCIQGKPTWNFRSIISLLTYIILCLLLLKNIL